MKKIVKIIIIIVLLGLVGIGGYYFYENYKETKKLENKIVKASNDYFQKYISAKDSASTYEIKLFDLEASGEDYDLKGLENCDKESTKAKITINYKNGKPKKTEVELKC